MTEDFPIPGGSEPVEAASAAKAVVLDRFIAKFIDFLIMGAFFAFPAFVGPLAGAAYILISDGLNSGQSLGKRVIGLKTVSIDTGLPCDFKQSLIRNAPFGILVALWYLIGWVPYIGKLFVVLACMAVAGIEMVLIYTDELGARFGDRIAGTAVVKGPKKI